MKEKSGRAVNLLGFIRMLPLIVSVGFAQGPSVLDLLASLDKTSYDVRFSELQVDEARGALRAARARRFPTIEAGTGGYWLQNPPEPMIVGKGSFGSLPLGQIAVPLPAEDVTVFEGQDPINYSLSLSITQPVFTWGKISRTIRLREQEVDAARAGVARTRAGAVTELLRALYAMQYLDSLSMVAAQLDSLSVRLVAFSADALETGQITTLDHTQNRIEAPEAARRRLELQTRRAGLQEQVSFLTGTPALQLVSVRYDGLRTWSSLPVPESPQPWVEEALRTSPEIASLTCGKAARESALRLARAMAPLHPDLALSVQGGYGKGANGYSFSPDGDPDYSLVVGVMLKGEIFDGGAASGTIAQRKAAWEQSSVALEQARQHIGTGLRQGWQQLRDLHDEINYRETRVRLRREVLTDWTGRQEVGAASQLESTRKAIDYCRERMQSFEKQQVFCDLYVQLASRTGSERLLEWVLETQPRAVPVTGDGR